MLSYLALTLRGQGESEVGVGLVLTPFIRLAITLTIFSCASYYVRSVDSSPAQFYVPEVMDSLLHDMEAVGAVVRKTAPGLPIWLGETSSARGGELLELLEYPINILTVFCKYEANASNTKARLKLVNYTESRPSPAKHAQSRHEDSLQADLCEKVREKVQRESFHFTEKTFLISNDFILTAP